jgi:hypothetical protein
MHELEEFLFWGWKFYVQLFYKMVVEVVFCFEDLGGGFKGID